MALLSRRRFHAIRVGLWAGQIPLATATPLKGSITYLVFLSLAALVESAGTDWDQARQKDKDDPRRAGPGASLAPMTEDTTATQDLPEDVDDDEDYPEQVATTGPAAADEDESQDPEVDGPGGPAPEPEAREVEDHTEDGS